MPRLRLLAAALPFVLAACARPDHIEIDPRAPRLSRKGESMHLHAKLMDRAGKVFPMESATWKSREWRFPAVLSGRRPLRPITMKAKRGLKVCPRESRWAG